MSDSVPTSTHEDAVVVDHAAMAAPPFPTPVLLTTADPATAVEEKRKRKKRSQESAERNRIMAKLNRDRKKKELYDLELKAAKVMLELQEMRDEANYLRECKEIQAGEIAKLRQHIKRFPDASAGVPAPQELPLAPQKMTDESLMEEARKLVKTEMPDPNAVALGNHDRRELHVPALPGVGAEPEAAEAAAIVRAPEPVNVPVPADQTAVLPPSLPPPDHAPAPLPPTQATSPAQAAGQKGGKRKTPADEEDDSAAEGDAQSRPKTRGRGTKPAGEGDKRANRGVDWAEHQGSTKRTTRSGKSLPSGKGNTPEDSEVAEILSSMHKGDKGHKAAEDDSEGSGPSERQKRH